MKLFTKALLKKLPRIGDTGEKDSSNIKVPVKFFNPCGSQTWYITEYNEEEKLAFGYVTGMQVDELGYISIKELEALQLPYGLKIEREYCWDSNNTLKSVMDKKNT